MSQQSSLMGCDLPEHLRLYYLDVMGIVCWQEQENFSPTIAETALPDVVPQSRQVTEPDIATQSVANSNQWLALEQAVSGCEKCEDLCQSRTQTVFGVGNKQADVFVIGEAPGGDEDKQGEPFVGRAGQLLNAMLKAIELEREEVFIANILKCRPQNNRDPLPQEVDNCSHYLRQQIELVQPKVILAVGRIAAQNLLATQTAIGKLRGTQAEFEGIPVIVTYHPAYLLRKPSEKRKAWQDLLRLQELISSWQ